MAATPPPRTKLHTPPTPLHGARYDAYQPYQTRQSTRQATKRAAQTPPPQSLESQSHLKSTPKSRKVSAVRSAAHTYSPPSSTQTSPQKKLFNTGKPQTRGSSNMDSSSLETDLFQETDGTSSSHQSGVIIGASMLPTPAKTPRKKQVQHAAGLSRVLFPVRPDTVEGAMPTPRKNKKTKRHVGFSLDSSMEDDASSEGGGIKIYTDSKDTVPELDQSEENPFIDHPLKRDIPEERRKPKPGKKRKAQPEAIGKQEIEEAFNHEEGMVYVFRGRKIFKRFPAHTSPQTEQLVSSHSDLDSPTTSSTHFTRSSIKPRLLFPTAQQQRERQIADEEATTDIEPQADDSEMTDLATDETEVEEQPVAPPVKATFEPASPPETGHATRSVTKKAGMGLSPPSGEVAGGGVEVKKARRSPFDGWARRKAGASASGAPVVGKGKKRQGEVIEKGDSAEGGGVSLGQKRVRSSGTATS